MYVDETLDENDQFPIVYQNNQFYDLELNTINHVAFAVADNPFFKMETEKYYPEAIIVNNQGQILSWLNANQTDSNGLAGIRYRSGFRDDKIRVNDDRKIEILLNDF